MLILNTALQADKHLFQDKEENEKLRKNLHLPLASGKTSSYGLAAHGLPTFQMQDSHIDRILRPSLQYTTL